MKLFHLCLLTTFLSLFCFSCSRERLIIPLKSECAINSHGYAKELCSEDEPLYSAEPSVVNSVTDYGSEENEGSDDGSGENSGLGEEPSTSPETAVDPDEKKGDTEANDITQAQEAEKVIQDIKSTSQTGVDLCTEKEWICEIKTNKNLSYILGTNPSDSEIKIFHTDFTFIKEGKIIKSSEVECNGGSCDFRYLYQILRIIKQIDYFYESGDKKRQMLFPWLSTEERTSETFINFYQLLKDKFKTVFTLDSINDITGILIDNKINLNFTPLYLNNEIHKEWLAVYEFCSVGCWNEDEICKFEKFYSSDPFYEQCLEKDGLSSKEYNGLLILAGKIIQTAIESFFNYECETSECAGYDVPQTQFVDLLLNNQDKLIFDANTISLMKEYRDFINVE